MKERLAIDGELSSEELAAARMTIMMLIRYIVNLQQESRKDVLIPSMLNKRAIIELMKQHIDEQQAFGVFLIDLNNFKKVNDKDGHVQGDELLINLGKAFRERFKRQGDAISLVEGRIGGDEFLIVADISSLGGRRADDMQVQMDNVYDLIKTVEAEFIEHNSAAQRNNVGFSIGSAYYDPASSLDLVTLLAQADEAMYEEKGNKGR